MLDPRVECVDRSPSKKQNSERESWDSGSRDVEKSVVGLQ